jgi:hypothetical protein
MAQPAKRSVATSRHAFLLQEGDKWEGTDYMRAQQMPPWVAHGVVRNGYGTAHTHVYD